MEIHPFITPIFISINVMLLCNAASNDVSCLTRERRALQEFKSGLKDPGNRLSSWSGVACCQWRGVVCDNVSGAVTGIDLHTPGGLSSLSGEIRPSLIHLRSLRHLDLSNNEFKGAPIPGFLGSLDNLEYLNLSNAGFSGIVPPALGNLSRLQYLGITDQGFSGLAVDDFQWVTGLVSLKHLGMNGVDLSLIQPTWLEMLNMLTDLTEVHLSACGLSGSISSLSHVNFTSLSVIDLSFNTFNSMFPDWLVNISSLMRIDLSNSMLRGRIPLSLSDLPRLSSLNLAMNGNLSVGIHDLLGGAWKSIEVLNFASNKIHGSLPGSIGNLTLLMDFNLFNNNVTGSIPGMIGAFCKLVNLDVSGNQITGNLPEVIKQGKHCGTGDPLSGLESLRLSANHMTGRLPEWLGKLRNLKELSLGSNMFEGPLPSSLGLLKHLTDLTFSGNRLNGTLPESIGRLSKLGILDASSNFFTGVLSESHFSRLRDLKILNLAFNSFVLTVSSKWIPAFQVRNLNLASCQLGPAFPRWLRSQTSIMFLDISNASISGLIPGWFWDLSYNLSLLNVSFNQLEGRLPSSIPLTPFADVDFSSNLFEGPIPLPSVPIELLDLSNNGFWGQIPQNLSEVMPNLVFLSLAGNRLTGEIPPGIVNMSSLLVIDLSGNNLTGSIPASIGRCSYLNALDLSNNHLSGEIPGSIGQLNHLLSLHLNDNSISGNLPSSLKNLSRLGTLDLGINKLEGNLPGWLGENFNSLRIMNLRANAFSGGILFSFSNFSALQVLDLAENNLTGRIPTSLGDLNAMAQEEITNEYLFYGKYRGVYYEESLILNWKNQFQKFTKTVSLVTAIDLSRNSLSGEIPEEITRLHGLMVLNLSMNHISGEIPETVSKLHQLASIDLSSNDLSGPIPASMASLSFLGYLNLSNNKLSGKIPNEGQMLTFEDEAFKGNPGLCGAPLEKCPDEDSGKGNNVNYEITNGLIDKWFYLSMGLGFAAGILVPYLILVMKKPWCDMYSDCLDKVVEKIFGGRV